MLRGWWNKSNFWIPIVVGASQAVFLDGNHHQVEAILFSKHNGKVVLESIFKKMEIKRKPILLAIMELV